MLLIVLERIKGFEPSRPAWKAGMLTVEHYIRIVLYVAKLSTRLAGLVVIAVLTRCFRCNRVSFVTTYLLSAQPHGICFHRLLTDDLDHIGLLGLRIVSRRDRLYRVICLIYIQYLFKGFVSFEL